MKVASLIGGAIAFESLANPYIITVCAAAINAASACSLVFSFGTKACDSEQRTSEWIALERRIDMTGERTFAE